MVSRRVQVCSQWSRWKGQGDRFARCPDVAVPDPPFPPPVLCFPGACGKHREEWLLKEQQYPCFALMGKKCKLDHKPSAKCLPGTWRTVHYLLVSNEEMCNAIEHLQRSVSSLHSKCSSSPGNSTEV